MVAALSQLHLQVVERGGACKLGKVLLQHAFVSIINGSINGLLNSCHFDINDRFLKRWNARLHIFLHSSQQIRFDGSLKSVNLLLVSKFSEVTSKFDQIRELARFYEVKKRPQFFSIILDRGSGEENDSFAGQPTQGG